MYQSGGNPQYPGQANSSHWYGANQQVPYAEGRDHPSNPHPPYYNGDRQPQHPYENHPGSHPYGLVNDSYGPSSSSGYNPSNTWENQQPQIPSFGPGQNSPPIDPSLWPSSYPPQETYLPPPRAPANEALTYPTQQPLPYAPQPEVPQVFGQDIASYEVSQPESPAPSSSLRIRIPGRGNPNPTNPFPTNPDDMVQTRRQSNASFASTSEYQDSNASIHDDDADADADGEPEVEVKEETVTSRFGRVHNKVSYKESEDELDLFNNNDDVEEVPRPRRGKRTTHAGAEGDDEDEEPDLQPRRRGTRNRGQKNLKDLVVDEDDDVEAEDPDAEYGAPTRRLRSHAKKTSPPVAATSSRRLSRGGSQSQSSANYYAGPPKSGAAQRAARSAAKEKLQREKEANDVWRGSSPSAHSPIDSDAATDDLDLEIDAPPEPAQDDDDDIIPADGRPYALRQRNTKINYAIPPPLEDIVKTTGGRGRNGGGGGGRSGGAGRRPKLGWSMSGADYGKLFGDKAAPGKGDDSDSDYGKSPRKGVGAGGVGGSAFAGAGMLPGDLAAAAGTPSNLGKIGDAALADADPLGVNMNVTFDEVGGLDDHIHQLKEMTLLPLLYPEVFQKFNVTPPRGVLFHGPPGTGKTLLARALAASCRADGRRVSFFMRKGADCLSKWVGEAERQLRLLFEEARNSQPSIIFFDEIDGLAPVRSSKQDQIHASIVSTLLALMDGMDGRGQVVVIGATNRPDAVDPALRRPGRFDREFYFPLPGAQARERILGIMTRGWKGWGVVPPTSSSEEKKGNEKGKEVEARVEPVPELVDEEEQARARDNIIGLAKLTKGYGGADLRALCTEAALNAIQRRYPQIYKTQDRLLLAPESIEVGLRDFMISIKKLVPSSARSSSSAATALPPQFEPLLAGTVERARKVVDEVMPREKRLTALEEAEFEDDGSLEKEMLMQSMETLRVYRPRLILHGDPGMGQVYVGAALLHHLEGYHVQSLELGALMGDSARTVEAAIVQLFVEAKRHQPSVVYIPALLGWCAAVSEVARSTVRAMLDTLAPTDPVLLLAVLDGPFSELPKDVRAWFGATRANRVHLTAPEHQAREAFFRGLLDDVKRPPNAFPDGLKRRKRVLEKLPIAPPLEPRKPTENELALQEEQDKRTALILQSRLILIVNELKRKFKRFAKRASDEYNHNFDADEAVFEPPPPAPVSAEVEIVNSVPTGPDGDVTMANGDAQQSSSDLPNGQQQQSENPSDPNDVGQEDAPQQQHQQMQAQVQEVPPPPRPTLHDMDLERISFDIYQGKYLTPAEFFLDILKIVHNAQMRAEDDIERYHRAEALRVAAEVSISDIDAFTKLECERMAAREKQRRDDRRRKKGKDKETPATNGKEPLRRSTRHNGPVPMMIQDPVALERQLKRRRGLEAGEGSVSSDGEQAAKRSKVSTDAEGEAGSSVMPNGILGSSNLNPNAAGPSTPSRNHVRFAGAGDDEFAQMQSMSPSAGHRSSQSARYHQQSLVPQGSIPSLLDGPGSLSSQQPQTNGMSAMEVGPHPPSGSGGSGFNVSLLNPAPGSIGDHNTPPWTPNRHPIGPGSGVPPLSQQTLLAMPSLGVAPSAPSLPSSSTLADTSSSKPSGPFDFGAAAQTSSHAASASSNDAGHQLPEPPQLPDPQSVPDVELESEPMQVERTPTPPLPDFHLDAGLLGQLESSLVDKTYSFTVEQLEQLRATCLGRVWRHRAEWDRDALVKELVDVVDEFVEEVDMETMEDP